MSREKLLTFFFEKNYMVPPDLFKRIPDDFDYDEFLKNNKSMEKSSNVVVLTEDMFGGFVDTVEVVDDIKTKVEIIQTYVDKPKKREMKHFVLFMKARYKELKKMLLQRMELQGAISIAKASSKKSKENVALIGFIYSKEKTKNGHIMIELEDPTGIIKVLVYGKDEELMKKFEEVVLDEVVGILGVTGDNIVFSKEVFFPDVPMKEYKKAKDDVCVAFISDLHVGSNLFAEKEFERFIGWLNLSYGSEAQKSLAKKVKYLFVCGDLIDGVGIYPGQDKELVIKDIYGQYGKIAEYFNSIRKDIKIVCIGGNHDALRLAEPQPPLSKDFARELYKIDNLILVSNPSVVRIHDMFDVLMYHGYCFDYYMNNVDYIRNAGGYEASGKMMEFCLKKRHLAPMYISTLKIPDINEDPMIIRHVPDFFVTGHVHYDVKFHSYKNVSMIGCSSFQYKTAFQDKLGHVNIVWGKVPIVNLKSREKFVMDFRDEA